jgi:hypothetical protein
MQQTSNKADLYRKVAAEYSDLAKNATSPFLRGYYQRIAEDYLVRVEGELRFAERESNAIPEQSGLSATGHTGG